MERKELIRKYIEFFKSKDHKEIKNSSLVPENDPTVLFTTAGMHPLVPFLLGEKHPQGKRLTNVQRCIRTGDINEVGDTCHHTFFEMLGNWSLGDYSKGKAIELTFEFHMKVLKIPLEKYAVSIFSGNKNSEKDKESYDKWMSLGVAKERIALLDDNWWGPAGNIGPCGPDTEMFFWSGSEKAPKKFNPNNKNWVEIGNDVLLEFVKNSSGEYIQAKQQNIDFGGGVERTLASLNRLDDNYLTEIWQPLIKRIETISGKKYEDNKKEMRIIADHIKAATFIIADGVIPGNAEQGYVLRRVIRRSIRNLKKIDAPILEMDTTVEIAKEVIKIYGDYDSLRNNKKKILSELKKEEDKFQKTLDKGLKEFQKMCGDGNIDNKECFLLYQSYGFPIEMTIELAEEKGIGVDKEGFHKELDKHQKLSRTASAGKFKSGLADNSEQTTKLHTACHLLNQALREVLNNDNIFQKGSNITSERLRFDFNSDRKLTDEEKKAIEDLVNKKIQEDSPIMMKEMDLKKAKAEGAHGVFDSKYGEKVKVYSIGDFSKEICAGPHVTNTSELGHFKIIKEESSSSGVRRIKAVLE